MDELALLPIAAAAGVLAVSCAAGWTGNHVEEIAASWREGRAQVAVWVETVVTHALLLATAAELWLLLHTAARKGGA